MKYYDTNEAIEILGISKQAIAKAVNKGKLKRYTGKQFIFSEEELKRYKERMKEGK
jgi:excisionase family DNA binding protein